LRKSAFKIQCAPDSSGALMAPKKGKDLIALARRGEPQMLLEVLRNNGRQGFPIELDADFALNLAQLIEDALWGRLPSSRKPRTKMSAETLATVRSNEFVGERIVERELRYIEEKQKQLRGKKMQLRGNKRAQTIELIARSIKPPYHDVTVASFDEYVKRKSRL
jgi:hypothetical protein